MAVFQKFFTPEETKTCYTITFNVPNGTNEILIKGNYNRQANLDAEKEKQLLIPAIHQYIGKNPISPTGRIVEPKAFETYSINKFTPLKNVFCYTVTDSTGEVRARSLRTFFNTLQISDELVGVGVVKGPVLPGEWCIVVDAQAVFSEVLVKFEVNFNKRITKGIPWSDAYTKEQSDLCALSHNMKNEKDSKWYCGDLHVHSHHSDGKHSVAELIHSYADQGLDFFVLSDHNIATGWSNELNQHMVVIPGMEMSTFYGHAVVLNTTETIDWFDLTKDSYFEDIIIPLQNKGALFSIAHPNTIGDPVCKGCRWEYSNYNGGLTDLLEVWAGSWSVRRIENEKTLKDWKGLLKLGYKVVAIGSTDTHKIDLNIKDYGRTYVYSESYTIDGIVDGLRCGRVFISSGPLIEFNLNYQTEHAGIGNELAVLAGNEIEIIIKVTDLIGKLYLKLFKDGDVIEESLVTSEKTLKYQDVVLGKGWYHVEMVDEDENLVLLTNPIYVNT